jgi:hypothetical protein
MRLKLLAGKDFLADTRFTYHRTWEKGLKPVTRVAGFNPQFFPPLALHLFGVLSSIRRNIRLEVSTCSNSRVAIDSHIQEQ